MSPGDPESARERAPLYLKAAVIVGAATILVGIAGVVWLPDPPALPAFVRVDTTLAPDTLLRARWTDRKGVHTEDGVQGRERDVWLFYRVPDGVPVTLQMFEGKRVVWQEPAVLGGGLVFVVER